MPTKASVTALAWDEWEADLWSEAGFEPWVWGTRRAPPASAIHVALGDSPLETRLAVLDRLSTTARIVTYRTPGETPYAAPWGLARGLWELNRRVVYVRDGGYIFDRRENRSLLVRAFLEHAFANFGVEVEGRFVRLAQRWVAWPLRFEVPSLKFSPRGGERLPDGSLNLWGGWPVRPVRGPIEPWVRLLDHVFAGYPTERRWFEQWCAWPIQHPGTKLLSSVLFWSPQQGTGKSILGLSLLEIYKQYGALITNDHLFKRHNTWAFNKLFVLADEVASSRSRREANAIKNLVTQVAINIDPKFLPEISQTSHLNFFFTSNHPDAFLLEDDDRRHFVWQMPAGRLDEAFFTQTYDPWLWGSGPSHLMEHLRTLDLTGFNPKGRPPVTPAKQLMIAHGRTELEEWIDLLRADPDAALAGVRDRIAPVLTTNALVLAYNAHADKPTTSVAMGRTLAKAGFVPFNQGRPVRIRGTLARAWIVRDVERWRTATPEELDDTLTVC